MITLALLPSTYLSIFHLCCYVLGLIIAINVALSIDYSKFIKAKSNLNYYLAAFAIGSIITYTIAELLYSLATLFLK